MLDAWIKRIFLTEPITLEKAGIKVFRSSQVNLRTQNESLEYRMITARMLHNLDEPEDYPTEMVGANPKSLKNQTLQVGDILISARAKFETIGLVTMEVLEPVIPTVAMIGMIIIRTGNENLSSFIKYYLELPIVQDYINNDSRTIKQGKRIIPIELMSELQFPDIFKNNFERFEEYSSYFKSIISTSRRINITINKLVDLQLGEACTIGIDNKNSYNPDEWEKLDKSLNNLDVDLGRILNSAGRPGGYTDIDEAMRMFLAMTELIELGTNKENGKI